MEQTKVLSRKEEILKLLGGDRYIKPSQTEAFMVHIRAASADQNVRWALIGGLAMQWHGCPRFTQNCDIACTKDLLFPNLEKEKGISSGGSRWKNADGSKLSVRVRHDEYRSLFEEAIENAVEEKGIFVVRAEWLAAMKFACASSDHDLDIEWLVRREKTGLVDVKMVSDLIYKHLGGQYARVSFRRFMEKVEINLRLYPDLHWSEYP